MFEERAAIREYDAGFSRAKAEWLARRDVTGHHSGCGCDRCEPLFLTPEQLSGAARQDRPASIVSSFIRMNARDVYSSLEPCSSPPHAQLHRSESDV